MNEDQFLKLYKYMDKRFSNIEERLDDVATKDDIRYLETVIDGYAAKIDDYAVEMAAMQHKIDRLERMIDYLAKHAGISKQTLESL